MVLHVYSYLCECGWSGQWVTGGFKRNNPLLDKVEEQLSEAKTPQSRQGWRELYQQILMGKIKSEEVSQRRGLKICSLCKSCHERIGFYDLNTGSPLHPQLCHHCGGEAIIYHQPDDVPCPSCQQIVRSREPLTDLELLQSMLDVCQVSFPTESSDVMMMAVGKRVITYLQPIEHEISYPLITVERHENVTTGGDMFEQLTDVKRVIFPTCYDNDFETELTSNLVKQLSHMNIEVVPIVVAPPLFEGNRRMKKTMELVQELQKRSKQTILLSGSALEKEHGPSIAIYREHFPSQLKKILQSFSNVTNKGE